MEKVTELKTLNGGSFSCRLRPEPEEDSEISIFDAKKYFNESGLEQKVVCNRVSPVSVNLDRVSEKCREDLSAGDGRFSSASSVETGYGRNYRSQSFHATPTASSEASWNSQTGLLTNPPGAVPVKLRNAADQEKKRGSTARWLFGRKCPCSGKKSVEVEGELSSEPKTPKLRLSLNQSSRTVLNLNSQKPKAKFEKPKPEMISISQTRHRRFSSDSNCQTERVSAPAASGFTFPILGQSGPAKLVLSSSVPARTDPPRDSIESLEVFRPSNQHRQIPPHPPHLAERDGQIFTFPTSPKSRVMMAAMAMAVEDDMASDASSDLFEIESFSTQTTATTTYQITGPRRDSLDEAASFNARRLSGGGGAFYRRSLDEPPTPSIAPTECYEPSEASIDWSVTTAEGFDRGSVTNYSAAASEFEEVLFDRVGDGGGKRRGKGLLSCRCEKAVSVGPHPQPVSEWVPPMVMGTKQGFVSGGRVAGGVGHKKPPLGSSGAARLSLAFAT